MDSGLLDLNTFCGRSGMDRVDDARATGWEWQDFLDRCLRGRLPVDVFFLLPATCCRCGSFGNAVQVHPVDPSHLEWHPVDT